MKRKRERDTAWSADQLSFEREGDLTRDNVPTTRAALFLPSADAQDLHWATAETAILVIKMDDALVVARMASDGVLTASPADMQS